eukprot:Opistho-2@11981
MGDDDLDLGECIGDSVDSLRRGKEGREENVFLGDFMVKQDADGHKCRRTARNRRVHEHHVTLLHVLGKAAVVELGLSCFLVRLDEDLANANILVNITQRHLHGDTGTDNGHATQTSKEPLSLVQLASGGLHSGRCVGKESESVFNEEAHEALRVVDELVSRGLSVTDDRVEANNLAALLEHMQGVGHLVANVQIQQVAAEHVAPLLQLSAHVMYDEVDCNEVVCSPGNNNIRVPHRRCNKFVKGGLHKLIILLEYTPEVACTLTNVTTKATRQTDVRVCIDEQQHIHLVAKVGACKGQNALKNDDVCSVYRPFDGESAVRREIVDGDLGILAFLELLESGHNQINVKCIRVVKVVLVSVCPLDFLARQLLVERVHGQQDHPRNLQFLDDALCHSCLSRSTATRNSNDERLLQLAIETVPRRASPSKYSARPASNLVSHLFQYSHKNECGAVSGCSGKDLCKCAGTLLFVPMYSALI